jgi:hypothetical protein
MKPRVSRSAPVGIPAGADLLLNGRNRWLPRFATYAEPLFPQDLQLLILAPLPCERDTQDIDECTLVAFDRHIPDRPQQLVTILLR